MKTETTSLIPFQKHAAHHMGHVLVLGLGKSGQAAFRYCYQLLGTRVASLSIAAGEHTQVAEDFLAEFDRTKVSISFETYEFSERYDLGIASPGIPQCSDFYQNASAACTELVSEVEFAWRESAEDSQWIGVTGTNGKTTTTALITHILNEAGLRASAVGNIGDTCLEAVAKGKTDIYVAELSSYQLASTKYFTPQVAVMLNITPDHLSWHGSYDAYREAKLKIFENLGKNENSWAIIDAVTEETRNIVKATKGVSDEVRGYFYVPVGTSQGIQGDMRAACGSKNAAFLSKEGLCIAFGDTEHALLPSHELAIKGEHNQSNALAAAAATAVLGIDDTVISAALRSFQALPHRIEPCGSVAGVLCYNDSKATNTDATEKALTAFVDPRPYVLLGGFDKGTNLDSFVKTVAQSAAAVVCFGAAGPRFYAAFSDASIPVYAADNLTQAFDVALSQATTGDTILLSPACASFDEFSSFEERGEVFKDLVKRRSEERGA